MSEGKMNKYVSYGAFWYKPSLPPSASLCVVSDPWCESEARRRIGNLASTR